MSLFAGALQELGGVFDRMAPEALEALVRELAQARRIVVAGAGRERLQVMGLAMRLYHLGLDAHVAGEMTCPPVGPGDLLLVTDGPGHLPGIAALMTGARGGRGAGAGGDGAARRRRHGVGRCGGACAGADHGG